MKRDICRKIGISQALKRFGGFVRYYDTTEPLPQLAAFVSAGDYRNILACCGGGNQALTMLGAGLEKNSLWAIDTNPAQLFVLAAKAAFFKQKSSMPSFTQLRQAYPGRIAAIKKNIRRFEQVQLSHTATGKIIAPPAALAERYALVMDGEMFVSSPSGPSWQKDKLFTAQVRAALGSLRFARMDIFDSPDHFKPKSIDLIYLSDIFWPEVLPYYEAKLARMAQLLRPGGRIITYLDPGDDFLGQGISPGRMLAQRAGELKLKVIADQEGAYLVLGRMG